jgi:transcriptional regulator with GAF, ATPase, and Fis domain/response regulator of citrate/malate metabolism
MFPQNPTTPLQTPGNVLVVEDEFAVANDLQNILENAGYGVTGIAFSVEEALHLLEPSPPDIVLLDIYLDGPGTGIDLARTLMTRNIPFVYISANSNESLMAEVKTTQPYGFVVKPFRERDILVTLELARYRHAHSQEAALRREKSLQIAVNDALMTIKERNALYREIARQVDQLVPISVFGLRVGTASGKLRYTITLAKSPDGLFQPFPLVALAGIPPERVEAESRSLLTEETGIFTGERFEGLCGKYALYHAFRSHLGCRSAIRVGLPLGSGAAASFALASPDPAGFTQAHYDLVRLIVPQITLALENLFAFEEIQAREQVKVSELALLNAFTSGLPAPAVMGRVAAALNEIIPCDLVGVYRTGPHPEASPFEATLVKQSQVFVPFATTGGLPRPKDRSAPEQKPGGLDDLLRQARLVVGEEHTQLAERNQVLRLYSEALGLKSSLFMPVTLHGKTVASLLLASRSAYAFTEKDLALLQQVSLQLALGLENQMAFERIQALSRQLELEKTYLIEEIKTARNFGEIISTSPAMQFVFRQVEQVSPTDFTVLILGETGTGKELIARAIHENSPSKERALIRVNCAALPPQLMESELFGHEKGSFTGAAERRIGKFELAHGSTIFLDEIGELPLELQPKLLRVLQEKEIERVGGKGPIACDARIIAATNRNLKQEVAGGRFRPDLFYRLNVFPITLPPLRERKEDILPLATHFLEKIAKHLGRPLRGIARTSVEQMLAYSWPGNIRELEHVLERAAILSPTPVVELTLPVPSAPSTAAGRMPETAAEVQLKTLQDGERDTIMAALKLANNRIRGKGGAAELLQVKPTTLEYKIKKLAIPRELNVQAVGTSG